MFYTTFKFWQLPIDRYPICMFAFGLENGERQLLQSAGLSKCVGLRLYLGSATVNAPYTSAMMTSSNGNIFRGTGLLWGKFIGHRWIPLTKASDAGLWCFLWSAPEHTVGQTIETPVILDAMALIMT